MKRGSTNFPYDLQPLHSIQIPLPILWEFRHIDYKSTLTKIVTTVELGNHVTRYTCFRNTLTPIKTLLDCLWYRLNRPNLIPVVYILEFHQVLNFTLLLDPGLHWLFGRWGEGYDGDYFHCKQRKQRGHSRNNRLWNRKKREGRNSYFILCVLY